jgi:hypothetical protein
MTSSGKSHVQKYRSAASRRNAQKTRNAWLLIGLVLLAVGAISAVYFSQRSKQLALDDETLCPSDPVSLTVLLVDVTDPMNLAQRQDFTNQLERLRNSIPRYGKLSIVKVDAASTRLLSPVIERCNPGTRADVDEYTGNPAALQKKWEEGFKLPLDKAFAELSRASSSGRSPILESVQSVALTEFQATHAEGKPRRLVIASDLLQNTDAISFYGELPDPRAVIESEAFRAARTDLRDVELELWMLQRPDGRQTQPRALPDLWDQLITSQGGTVTRVYTVSG